jgi:hypothetical protein
MEPTIMKEFMFFIRKQTNSKHSLSPERHQQFLKGCERYIDKLTKDGKLISAQPIEWSGNIVSNLNGTWQDAPFNETNEIIGGYYHILAKDLNEAIAIAQENPEFQFNPNTRIEVRPIKMKEESTGYEYPKG